MSFSYMKERCDELAKKYGSSSYQSACDALTPETAYEAYQYYVPCAQGCLSQNTSMDPADMDGSIFYCADMCAIDGLSRATGIPLSPPVEAYSPPGRRSENWDRKTMLFVVLLLALLVGIIYYLSKMKY